MKNLKNLQVLVALCIARGFSVWHFEISIHFSQFLIELFGEVLEDTEYDEEASRMCYNPIERTENGFKTRFYDLQDPWGCYAYLEFDKASRELIYTTFRGFQYVFREGEHGMEMDFWGPRAAFAAQTIMPEVISNILSWNDCVGMTDADRVYWSFQEVKEYYRKVDGYDFWKTSDSKEETPVVKTSSKRFMSHEEGRFNEPKWDHCYCSHYSKGKTMRSHRNPRATRISGYFHKQLPEWLWKKMVKEGEW